jgi:cytochrome c556
MAHVEPTVCRKICYKKDSCMEAKAADIQGPAQPSTPHMKETLAYTLALLGAVLSAPASAQFARADDAVKYRQSALSLMGTHFTRIGAMANGRVPFDGQVATENAELVATLSHLPWAGFGPGTDKISQRAKPEIWTQQARFIDFQQKLTAETAKLAAAAKTNNLDNLRAAFSATAGACKNCHDVFRGN